MVWPFNKAKKAVQSADPRQIVQDEINKLKGTLKREIVNEIKSEINSVKQQTKSFQRKFSNIDGIIQSKVQTSLNSLEGSIGNKIIPITDDLKDIQNKIKNLDDVIIHALKIAVKKAEKVIIDKAEDYVGLLVPDEVSPGLGWLSLDTIKTDMATIKGIFHWFRDEPKNPESILEFLEQVKPEKIVIAPQIELPVINAGLQFPMAWYTDRFIGHGRKLLDSIC